MKSQRQGTRVPKRKRDSDAHDEKCEDEAGVEAPARKKEKVVGRLQKGIKSPAADISNRKEESPPPPERTPSETEDGPPPPGDERAPEPEEQEEGDAGWMDEMMFCMFLEYLELGDLDKWLKKASEEGKRWPSLLLWNIFHCCAYSHHHSTRTCEKRLIWTKVFKACVGMRYPPIERLPDDESRAEKTLLEERGPAEEKDMDVNQLVHFDIDPRNSMHTCFTLLLCNVVPIPGSSANQWLYIQQF